MEQKTQDSSSHTQTAVENQATYVLRLNETEDRNRSTAQAQEQHIEWVEGTINNENLGRKKSKRCCIYHKPRAFDESGSESEGCDSASDDEFSQKYPQYAVRKKPSSKEHGHGHSHGCNHNMKSNTHDFASES